MLKAQTHPLVPRGSRSQIVDLLRIDAASKSMGGGSFCLPKAGWEQTYHIQRVKEVVRCEPSVVGSRTCNSPRLCSQFQQSTMCSIAQTMKIAFLAVIGCSVVSKTRADGHEAAVPTCPMPESVVEFKGNPKDRIFHQISGSEMSSIVEYLKAEGVVDLNRDELESSFDALNTNYIMNFGLALPPKAEVLDFLDADGPEPDRYAIVTVNRGAGVPKDVMVSNHFYPMCYFCGQNDSHVSTRNTKLGHSLVEQ